MVRKSIWCGGPRRRDVKVGAAGSRLWNVVFAQRNVAGRLIGLHSEKQYACVVGKQHELGLMRGHPPEGAACIRHAGTR